MLYMNYILEQYPKLKEFCPVVVPNGTGQEAGGAAMPTSWTADGRSPVVKANSVSEKLKA